MSAAVTNENWNLSGLNTVGVFPLSSQAPWGLEWGATPAASSTRSCGISQSVNFLSADR